MHTAKKYMYSTAHHVMQPKLSEYLVLAEAVA